MTVPNATMTTVLKHRLGECLSCQRMLVQIQQGTEWFPGYLLTWLCILSEVALSCVSVEYFVRQVIDCLSCV